MIYFMWYYAILTEQGNLSLFSWYLREKLSLLMRCKTYMFGQIDFFLKRSKINYFIKSKFALRIGHSLLIRTDKSYFGQTSIFMFI